MNTLEWIRYKKGERKESDGKYMWIILVARMAKWISTAKNMENVILQMQIVCKIRWPVLEENKYVKS